MSADSVPPPETPIAETPAPATPTKRPRGRRLLAWAAGLFVVFLVFVALIPTLLSTAFAKQRILAKLDEDDDRTIAFQKLDLTWSGARLEGLHFVDHSTAGAPTFDAPAVDVDVSLLSAAFGKIRVKKCVLRDAVVRIDAREEAKPKPGRAKKPKPPEPPKATAKEESSFDVVASVEVKNLTVVYIDKQGRETRQSGIDFVGNVDSTGGPSKFELNVPSGAGGLHATGGLTFVTPAGAPLPKGQHVADVAVEMNHIDAESNRALLAPFLGDDAASGVIDGKIAAHVVGQDASGDFDVHVSKIGFRAAAKTARARDGDDLTLTGKFATKGDRIEVSGCKVRADGVALDADVAGTLDALEGKATIDVDLARVAAKAHACGAEFKGALGGKITGSIQFTPSPSSVVGDLTLTGLRAAGFVDDSPPVTIETASIRFVAATRKDGVDLKSLDVTLPDLTASVRGSRASDGTLDVTTTAKGDLGGLVARVRDLGLAPAGVAINGSLDAEIHAAGKPDALNVEIKRFALTEKDAKIEASGTRAADGTLDFRASGSGDLGALLGRANAAGQGPKGLENVHARFAFDATAKGAPDKLDVNVPKLHVEGDFALDAHAKLAPDGSIDAEITCGSERVDDLLVVAKRMGFLDRDVSLGGSLACTATVKGTRTKPEIPRATLKMSGGAIVVDVNGSVDAAGALKADASLDVDVESALAVARKAGFLTITVPSVGGHLTAKATASGTRDKIEVPTFDAKLVDSLALVEVHGSVGADRVVAAKLTASGDVDRVVRFARDGGWLKREADVGGTFSLAASASGAPDKIAVPNASFEMKGPLHVAVDGSVDATHAFTAKGKIDGAVQTLLDLAAAWSGTDAKRLDGSIDGSFTASGTPDQFEASLPSLTVRAGEVKVDLRGSRGKDGAAKGDLKASGPIDGFLAIAHAFGYAADVEANGILDAKAAGSMTGSKAEGSLDVVATDLVVAKPDVGGKPIREPKFSLSVASAVFDLDKKELAPTKARVDCEGARIDATLKMSGDVVVADGTIVAQQKFAENHADQLSGCSFGILAGPFHFEGDVTKGREKASAWTGDFTLDASGVTAPHVAVSAAKLPCKLANGVLVVDPITATVNGGPVTGRAEIGLAGESPAHHLVLNGKDVGIDEDLAPLIAHASPLFAVGEDGKAGGKASIDVDLTASGLGADALKKSMTGKGVLGLDGAFVQSTNWLGELMQFVGQSNRVEVKPVKVPFDVKNSKVTTGEIPVEAAGLLIRLGGHVGFDTKIDYALRLKSLGGGGTLSKFSALFDKEGYLPLALTGTLSKPKLKLPSLKDVLKGGLGGLLGGK